MEDIKIPLTPLNKRILIKPIIKEKSDTGIILPDAKENQTDMGEVLAYASDRENYLISLGSIVFFKKYVPDEIELDGEKFLIINENEILAYKN